MRPAVEPPARCHEESNRTVPFRVSGDVCVFPSLLEERMPKMRKMMVSLCAAAALLFTGTAVRADPLWSYNTTTVPDIVASTFQSPINTTSVKFKGGSGNVTGT